MKTCRSGYSDWKRSARPGRLSPVHLLGLTLVVLGACAPRSSVPVAVPSSPPCVQQFPLFISIGEHEVAPGAVDTLQLWEHRGPFGPRELPAGCAPTWSVAPGAPAAIAPETGVLRVNADTPDGAVFTVSAQLGEEIVESVVRVVDPVLNPLVGRWTQISRTRCDTGRMESPGDEVLRELVFHGNGRFTVTWQPFESYIDYWGTYRFEPESGEIRLEIDGGNYIPDRVDLEGKVRFAGSDELHLLDMSLGTRHPDLPAVCSAGFRRGG